MLRFQAWQYAKTNHPKGTNSYCLMIGKLEKEVGNKIL
jgi:hypothetical protein